MISTTLKSIINKKSKSFWTVSLIAIIIALAFEICLSLINDIDAATSFIKLLRTFFYIGLLIAWGVYSFKRVTDKKERILITICVILLVALQVIKLLKHRVFTNNDYVDTILWYLYYFPFLFVAIISFWICFCSFYSNKKLELVLFPILIIIGIALFAITMSNNYHQLVFKFNGAMYDGTSYSYGPLYYVVVSFICSMVIGIFSISFIELSKQHFIKKTAFLLFLTLTIIFVVYLILYAIKLIHFWNDICNSVSVFFIIFMEFAFSFNFIITNSLHKMVFNITSHPITLLNQDGSLAYRSDSASVITKPLFSYLIEHETCSEDSKRFSLKKIHGGYLVWEDDLRQIQKDTLVIQKLNDGIDQSIKELEKQEENLSEIARLSIKNKAYKDIEDINKRYSKK